MNIGTFGHGPVVVMVQQFCLSYKCIWKCIAMPGPSQAQQGVSQTGAQGQTLHVILPRLEGTWYLTPTEASAGYLNLKLDE